MLDWSTATPAIGAAFFASLVEVVEAFTIVLVVATLRGWGHQFIGPEDGLLACGYEGVGRLAEVADIVARAAAVVKPLTDTTV